MALITLLGFLPNLVLSVFTGVLADKYDRRNLMIIGDGLSDLGIIYILICMFVGNISRKQAVEKAESEYEKYRIIQDQKYISSMDAFNNKYLKESDDGKNE